MAGGACMPRGHTWLGDGHASLGGVSGEGGVHG